MGCFAVVRGKAIRVTEVDDCGAIPEDANYVVSNGFVQVQISADNEAGDEILVKNANGDFCINERSPDGLKRLNITVDWCNVDPDIMNMITGFPLVPGDSPGEPVGFDIVEGTYDATFALEVWTGLGGQRCADGNECFGYLLLPLNTGAALGDFTIENGAATFQTTGYTVGGSEWGVGPYMVEGEGTCDSPLTTAIPADGHARLMTVCCPPPSPACGTVPVPNGG